MRGHTANKRTSDGSTHRLPSSPECLACATTIHGGPHDMGLCAKLQSPLPRATPVRLTCRGNYAFNMLLASLRWTPHLVAPSRA